MELTDLDQETISWIESRKDLIEWLIKVEELMMYGKIVINYHQGEIVSYDICARERVEVSIDK